MEQIQPTSIISNHQQSTANHQSNISHTQSCSDHQDHTFCGILFPVHARTVLPIERLVIRSVAVRGALGDLTVWVSNDNNDTNTNDEHRFRLDASHWTQVYSRHHASSFRQYQTLQLDTPIVLLPGQTRALYIHSTLPGDDAIVYDNASSDHNNHTTTTTMLTIGTGKAHLSPSPFGTSPIWGWGVAWRDRREFVGQIEYGVLYQLWDPPLHTWFGSQFDAAVRAVLACQRREDCVWSTLPDECVYYIFNMCRWDWFGDGVEGMEGRHVARKRKARIAALVEAASVRANEDNNDDGVVGNNENNNVVAAVAANNNEAAANPDVFVDAAEEMRDEDDDDWNADMEEDQDDMEDGEDEEWDDEEEDEDEDEDDDWEFRNGYRASGTYFYYRYASDDDEDEDDDERHQMALERRRRLAQVHIIRALMGG